MSNLRCAKPATLRQPASKIERLGGAFDLENSKGSRPSQAADSRRLIGVAALPRTALADAMTAALARKAGAS